MPFVLALVLSAAGCAVVGVLIQKAVYEPIERRGGAPLILLIASLGLLISLQNIVAMLFSPNILQFDLQWRTSTVALGPTHLSIPQLLTAFSGIAIFLAIYFFSNRTLLGKRIKAVAANRFLADITRLQPKKVHAIVLAIASAGVAVPGTMLPLDQGLQPYTGILILLVAKIAVLAGGIGNVAGTFTVAIMLGVLQNVALTFISGQWTIALTFSLFVALMLFKPTGLFRAQ